MSINDATTVASAAAASTTTKKISKALNNNILIKTLHQFTRKCYKSYNAKSFDQLPDDGIGDLNPDVFAYYSGPDVGIGDVSLASFRKAPPSTKPPEDEKATEKQIVSLNPIKEEIDNVQMSSIDIERKLVYDCWDSFHKLGIQKWNLSHHRAYGIACSLYENNLVANYTVGDPVADCFALLARKNSSILVLADGVNWGPRSRLAARCACRASLNFINRNLFYAQNKTMTTHDVFRIMCRAFDAAQGFILQRKGTMTTLCCSVVLKLKESNPGSNGNLWVVCTLSIGDSTAYVFNKTKGVFELTTGARNVNDDRDMRNVGGGLGHVYGDKPDVSNLNYSLMYIKENDIVFLVSDGVSDNLDPIVSQTARRSANIINDSSPSNKPATNNNSKINRSSSQLAKNNSKQAGFFFNNAPQLSMKKSPSSTGPISTMYESNVSNVSNFHIIPENITKAGDKGSQLDSGPLFNDDQTVNLSSLPEMSPYERYLCSLAHMNEILLRNRTLNDELSAQETCAILIEHVMRLTAQKRETLEKGIIEAASLPEPEKAIFQAKLREKAQKMRGKLDHASIVAYEVGVL